MHYTALAGTVYYPGTANTKPPQPEMATQSLIGVVAGIVVFACIILCILSTKGRIERIKSFFLKNNKDRQKRIFLGLVLFDTNGRILVKVDGTVPTKEILSEDERNPNVRKTYYFYKKEANMFLGHHKKFHTKTPTIFSSARN